MGDPESFENVRDFLSPLIGRKIIDITQNDEGEDSFVQFLMEDGIYITFPISMAGFYYGCIGDALDAA